MIESRMESARVRGIDSSDFQFPIPLHEKVYEALGSDKTVETGLEGVVSVPKILLLQTCVSAILKAWHGGIEPLIDSVRGKALDDGAFKGGGTDFFTQADLASEKIIQGEVFSTFGIDNVRFFGEEANAYSGNVASHIGFRADPIDGTRSFKMGKKPDWSVMVGVYAGQANKERQVVGAMYFPERGELVYQVEDIPSVFILNLKTRVTSEVGPVSHQDNLRDVLVSIWKHTNRAKSGPIDEIESKLRDSFAHIVYMDSASGDVLEALATGGRRIIIADGDMNTVDYIAFKMLQKMGYAAYDWTDEDIVPINLDSCDLTERRTLMVPPGTASETVLKVIREVKQEKLGSDWTGFK